MVMDKIRRAFSGGGSGDSIESDYIEIDLEKEKSDQKVIVKLFALKHYEEVNDVLNALRDGFTIAIVDIKVLRQRDSIELKRAVSKIKKTIDALDGTIAGFGENMVIATPSFAKIHKHAPVETEKKSKFED